MLNPQANNPNTQLKDIAEKLNANFDVGLFIFLLIKNRLFILSFFLISFISAFFYLRYSQPIYESKAIIQINDANRADQLLKFGNANEEHNVIAEAIEQIRSKVFLKRVLNKMILKYLILLLLE